MSEANILIPDKKIMKIGNRNFSISKLKLRQYLRLSKLIMCTINKSKEKIKELKDNTSENTTEAQDLMFIFNMLDEKDLYKAICILLDIEETEEKFISENTGAEEISELIAIVCELNNFQTVKKNVERVTQVFKSEKK